MTEHCTPTNGNLVTATKEKIAAAITTYGSVPGRRTLAADLGVTEYRIRQAMTHPDPELPPDRGRPTAGGLSRDRHRSVPIWWSGVDGLLLLVGRRLHEDVASRGGTLRKEVARLSQRDQQR